MKVYLNEKIGKYIVIYIVVTYIMYLILPMENVHTDDMKELYSIIFLSFVCVAFYYGAKSVPLRDISVNNIYRHEIKNKYLTIILIALIVITSLSVYDLVQMGYMQMSLSMGENYANIVTSEQGGEVSLWGQLATLTAPVKVFVCVYCIYEIQYVGKINILLLVILFITLLAGVVGSGQQVGFGNIIVLILVPIYIKCKKNNQLRILKKYVLVLGTAFLVFFLVNQFMRAEVFGYDLADDVSNKDNVFFMIFGSRIGSGLMNFFNYFVHGYKGLNYSLQLPFEWTFGYGGSRALDQYVEQYLGFDSEFNNTYPMRVMKVFNYDCQMKWPTAFAWWASDFSFFGVIVLMFFIAKLTCRVYKDAYLYSNIYAIAFLTEIVIMLVFLPMNNQALQGRDSLLITFGLGLLWLLKRRKYIRKTA